jgi:hypothetical protein
MRSGAAAGCAELDYSLYALACSTVVSVCMCFCSVQGRAESDEDYVAAAGFADVTAGVSMWQRHGLCVRIQLALSCGDIV